MATPGYPQMGQMPQMGGAPMGGPMGGMNGPTMGVRPPVRRGTSKAVPVVVSAGLAVGVFCGLLFGVGTGKKDAHAAPVVASNVKKEVEAKPEPGAAPAGLGATSTSPVPAKPTTPTTPAVATGSAAPQPTTPTTPAKPEEKKIKLTVKIKPEAAQKDAKVTVDDKDIDGMVADIPGDKKQVKVEVKATGYHSYEKKLDLVGDEMTLEIELSKRPSGGATTPGTGVHPPKRPDRPPSGGGGLIDI